MLRDQPPNIDSSYIWAQLFSTNEDTKLTNLSAVLIEVLKDKLLIRVKGLNRPRVEGKDVCAASREEKAEDDLFTLNLCETLAINSGIVFVSLLRLIIINLEGFKKV